PVRAVRVDEHGERRALDVREKERRPAPVEEPRVGALRGLRGRVRRGRLAHPVGDLGDLQHRRHGRVDADELARPFERGDEGLYAWEHGRERYAERAADERVPPTGPEEGGALRGEARLA